MSFTPSFESYKSPGSHSAAESLSLSLSLSLSHSFGAGADFHSLHPPSKVHPSTARIPPHKRSIRDMENQSLTPQSEGKAKSRGYSVDSEDLISILSAVGLTDDDKFPTSVQMERVPRDIFEPGKKKTTRILVCDHPSRDVNETSLNSTKSPWLSIAENIQEDLHTSFQKVVNKMQYQYQSSGEIRPSFVARIGKVFFHGRIVTKNTILGKLLGDKSNAIDNMRNTFHTNVTKEYMEAVEGLVVQRTEFGFESKKEHYYVKVLGKQGETLSCKCSATKDGGKLEIHKVELITKRHFIADTSCLAKDFDLRLMLFTRETSKLDDKDQPVKMLIESANIDPNAKGGLSWPPGKDCIGDRFSVGAVWHDRFKVFKGPTMTLKLRDADRNDFKNPKKSGVTKEVVVKMTEITKQLRDRKVPESEAVDRMFQEALKFLWEKLLNDDRPST